MIFLFLICIFITGCAGLGLEKKATLMPDEISVSVDADTRDNWYIDEVTLGAKWKLK